MEQAAIENAGYKNRILVWATTSRSSEGTTAADDPASPPCWLPISPSALLTIDCVALNWHRLANDRTLLLSTSSPLLSVLMIGCVALRWHGLVNDRTLLLSSSFPLLSVGCSVPSWSCCSVLSWRWMTNERTHSLSSPPPTPHPLPSALDLPTLTSPPPLLIGCDPLSCR